MKFAATVRKPPAVYVWVEGTVDETTDLITSFLFLSPVSTALLLFLGRLQIPPRMHSFVFYLLSLSFPVMLPFFGFPTNGFCVARRRCERERRTERRTERSAEWFVRTAERNEKIFRGARNQKLYSVDEKERGRIESGRRRGGRNSLSVSEISASPHFSV